MDLVQLVLSYTIRRNTLTFSISKFFLSFWVRFPSYYMGTPYKVVTTPARQDLIPPQACLPLLLPSFL